MARKPTKPAARPAPATKPKTALPKPKPARSKPKPKATPTILATTLLTLYTHTTSYYVTRDVSKPPSDPDRECSRTYTMDTRFWPGYRAQWWERSVSSCESCNEYKYRETPSPEIIDMEDCVYFLEREAAMRRFVVEALGEALPETEEARGELWREYGVKQEEGGGLEFERVQEEKNFVVGAKKVQAMLVMEGRRKVVRFRDVEKGVVVDADVVDWNGKPEALGLVLPKREVKVPAKKTVKGPSSKGGRKDWKTWDFVVLV